jgi:hypothetical protein
MRSDVIVDPPTAAIYHECRGIHTGIGFRIALVFWRFRDGKVISRHGEFCGAAVIIFLPRGFTVACVHCPSGMLRLRLAGSTVQNPS